MAMVAAGLIVRVRNGSLTDTTCAAVRRSVTAVPIAARYSASVILWPVGAAKTTRAVAPPTEACGKR